MARSTSTPTAGVMPATTACSYWSAKRWRRRRESTSARMAPRATCALPIPARWGIWNKPPAASNALRLLRLLPEGLQARELGEHLVGVLRARLVEGAGVHLQRRFRVAESPLVFAQDLRADLDVDLGLEQRVLAAVALQGQDHHCADRGKADQRQRALRAAVGACHDIFQHLPPPCPGALFGLWVG